MHLLTTQWVPKLSLNLLNQLQDTNGASVFIGGQRGDNYHFSEKLYKLESVDAGWTEMKQTLKVPRNNFAAFLVPDSAITC